MGVSEKTDPHSDERVLVPREPTQEMIAAGLRPYNELLGPTRIYEAMISASPIPPSPSQIIRATGDVAEAALIQVRAALIRLRRCLDGDELRSLPEEAAALAAANAALKAMSLSATTEQTQRDYLTRDRDIILEAINTYDEWMKDDDYDWHGILQKIIGRMRERADLMSEPPLSATTPRVTGEYRPQVEYNADLRLTAIALKDSYALSVPWTAGGTIKGHAVDCLYDEDGSLIGVQIWDDVRTRPAITPRQPDDGDAADLVKRLHTLADYIETGGTIITGDEARDIHTSADRLAALGAERDSFASDNNDAHAEAILWKQRAEKALADLASLRAALEGASAGVGRALRALHRVPRVDGDIDEAEIELEAALSSLKTQEPAK